MISVIVNGKPLQSPGGTLAELCRTLGHDKTGKFATAVNGTFVPAGQRTTTMLAEGDQVEIVTPRQGG